MCVSQEAAVRTLQICVPKPLRAVYVGWKGGSCANEKQEYHVWYQFSTMSETDFSFMYPLDRK